MPTMSDAEREFKEYDAGDHDDEWWMANYNTIHNLHNNNNNNNDKLKYYNSSYGSKFSSEDN